MNLAHHLKTQIEQWAEEFKTENPFYIQTSKGQLSRFQLANYIYNIIYLTLQAFAQLRLNRSLAAKQELWDLVAFYDQKLIEEADHDVWAENDLKALKLTSEEKRHLEVLPGMLRMMEHVYECSFQNPTLLLNYFYLTEYFTVLAGQVWLKAVQEKTGFSSNQTTIIGNHVTLDQEHAAEDLEVLSSLVEKYPSFLRIEEAEKYLSHVMVCFNQFCDEVIKSDQRVKSSYGEISGTPPVVSP